jgi:hypothetical protein
MKPCASCVFFIKNLDVPETESGFCHRYPPSVFLKGEEYRSLFAPVRADFTCGEHKAAISLEARRRRRSP